MVLVTILYGIGLLTGLFVVELLLVALLPGFEVPPQPMSRMPGMNLQRSRRIWNRQGSG